MFYGDLFMDGAGCTTFASEKEAKDYLSSLSSGVSGRAFKTESGKWAVSWRKSCTCGPDYQDRYCPRHGTLDPATKW